MRKTALERFWEKVEKTDDCWLWTAAVSTDGYGRFRVDSVLRIAHRWAYQQFVGPVPDGLELDHLCHTRNLAACVAGGYCPHRRCVNPAHLEPVTPAENNRRRVRRPVLSGQRTQWGPDDILWLEEPA